MNFKRANSFETMINFNEENQMTEIKICDKKRDVQYEEYAHAIMDKSVVKERRWKRKFWQIFPVFCASLIAVPFGMMLGWPSPTYPYLLQKTSEIPISYSQSAMIAGFLMLGLTISTPFSSKYHLGPKYGIWIGMVFIIIGWILMWYSQNIFWILGSRLVVGLGAGYGMGQVKGYIHDMCEPKLALHLTKQLNFYAFFGVIVTFASGPFLEFRKFPFVPVITSFIFLIILMFLPCTPKDFIKNKNMDKAVMLLNYLRGKVDHTIEIKRMQDELIDENDQEFLIPVFKDKRLLVNLIKFVTFVFLQQFSGAPTTLVYSQIIFEKSHTPYEEYCAIFYIIIFFFSSLYGTFYSPSFNRRRVLILSSVVSSFSLLLQILILYFEVNEKYWSYSSLVALSLFISSYNIGIGSLTVTYIPVWFPKKFKIGISNLFLMEFYMLALLATKIFQVLFTEFNLYVGFCMFLLTDVLFLIFVLIFVKKNPSNFESYTQNSAIYFWNTKTPQRKESMQG